MDNHLMVKKSWIMELLIVVGLLLLWLVLQIWVLPRLGVRT
jgi:hypothetical protein